MFVKTIHCAFPCALTADYITINLGVRAGLDLHLPEHRATLRSVLAAVSKAQTHMAGERGLRRPLAVKVVQSRGDTNALLPQHINGHLSTLAAAS